MESEDQKRIDKLKEIASKSKPVKSAEDVLKKYIYIDNNKKPSLSVGDALLAMEAYASQFPAPEESVDWGEIDKAFWVYVYEFLRNNDYEPTCKDCFNWFRSRPEFQTAGKVDWPDQKEIRELANNRIVSIYGDYPKGSRYIQDRDFFEAGANEIIDLIKQRLTQK